MEHSIDLGLQFTGNTKYSRLDMQLFIDRVRTHNMEYERLNGRPATCFTHSYGCQQNVADGEKINGLLLEMGYRFCESEQEADFILYNTCAVREGAEDRVFGNVGALKHAKKRNPDLVIALCGCMMQQEHVTRRIRKSFPHVDLLFGANSMHQLPQMLCDKLNGQKRVFFLNEDNGEIIEGLPVHREGGVKAWLPIMHGCNNFCTYCIVPFVRGRERSREPDQILEEARQLVAEGYKELTLLGQNVNSYGKGLARPVNFSSLLRQINEIPGEFRIRFMTSHPKDCSHELLDTIGECEKICKHLHLPVQSGSNRVLASMNRGYTREQYLDLISYAKDHIPGITFTSDIIVGFPGETYEEFLQTLELVENVGFQSLFTFLYSRRQGTRAAEMEDPVGREEKQRWFNELLAVQNNIGGAQYQELVGTTVRVLAEGAGKTGEGMLMGRTPSNIITEFEADKNAIGTFVNLKITKAMNWAVFGELDL